MFSKGPLFPFVQKSQRVFKAMSDSEGERAAAEGEEKSEIILY